MADDVSVRQKKRKSRKNHLLVYISHVCIFQCLCFKKQDPNLTTSQLDFQNKTQHSMLRVENAPPLRNEFPKEMRRQALGVMHVHVAWISGVFSSFSWCPKSWRDDSTEATASCCVVFSCAANCGGASRKIVLVWRLHKRILEPTWKGRMRFTAKRLCCYSFPS